MLAANDHSSREFLPALRSRNRELAASFARIMRNFARRRNLFDDGPMTARLSDYDYDLPWELIANRPLQRREDSRMMVLHSDRQTIDHCQFHELKKFLRSGDLLVVNDTRVLPPRRLLLDGVFEFWFLEHFGPKCWTCVLKPVRE